MAKFEDNRFVVVANEFVLEVIGDRLAIEEDKFKTGRECKKCDGDGFTSDPCPMCLGRNLPAGVEGLDEDGITGIPCRLCCTQHGRGVFGLNIGKGKKTCEECNGKGALIVLPQETERRTTTGVIRSAGPDISKCPTCQGRVVGINSTPVECERCNGSGTLLKVGDRVIFTIFAGTGIHFMHKGTCRIVHENEIMGKVYGKRNIGELVK